MLTNLLLDLGLPQGYLAPTAFGIKLLILLVLCLLVDFIAKKFVLALVCSIVRKTKNDWDDVFVDKQVFKNVSHFAPALIVYFLVPILFEASPDVILLVKRLANAYMIVVACGVIDAVLNAVMTIYDRFDVSYRKPIKGYVQAIKVIIYLFTVLFVVATLLDKSPWGFLSIFGGLTAVLLLVFKDMILGLVAGIQLSANNMVAKGDWIEMPKYGADGDVIDMTLTTVMVQNWDKTVTTIPAYALMSDSFKNWRGMQQSGGRRIKRSINIDMNSVKFVDQTMLDKFSKFEFLKRYLENKIDEISKYNQDKNIDTSELTNGRRLTNIGTLRAYIINYLRNHPKINQNMTFLVRQLEPTAEGLPIQIYVFSSDQVWANYEAIQADIFDHIIAVIPEFSLNVYQRPTGSDFSILAK